MEPWKSRTGQRMRRAPRVHPGNPDVKRLRKTLLAKGEELSSDLDSSLNALASRRDSVVADTTDMATSDEVQLIAGEIGEVVSGTVAEIGRALEKLDEGTYGRCDDCGAPIAAGRLRAIRWATRCVACQEQRERESRKSRELPPQRGVLASVPWSREERWDAAFFSVRATRLG